MPYSLKDWSDLSGITVGSNILNADKTGRLAANRFLILSFSELMYCTVRFSRYYSELGVRVSSVPESLPPSPRSSFNRSSGLLSVAIFVI